MHTDLNVYHQFAKGLQEKLPWMRLKRQIDGHNAMLFQADSSKTYEILGLDHYYLTNLKVFIQVWYDRGRSPMEITTRYRLIPIINFVSPDNWDMEKKIEDYISHHQKVRLRDLIKDLLPPISVDYYRIDEIIEACATFISKVEEEVAALVIATYFASKDEP